MTLAGGLGNAAVDNQQHGDLTERERLSRFFRFAEGVLAARDQVILRMSEAGLGVFVEDELAGLPGLSFNADDDSWLVLKRLRENPAPLPEAPLAPWLDGRPDDPMRPPKFKPVRVLAVSVEDASDLCEGGLLDLGDIAEVVEEDPTVGARGQVSQERVEVALRLERLEEVRNSLEGWRAGPWEDWARAERPVRRSIGLYNTLFKIHNMLHGGVSGTPPEVVWGIGLARWRLAADVIDMPLIEQLVDLEVHAQGTIVVRPRDVRPSIVMKPFLHRDVEGSGETQRDVQALFDRITESDEREITPFEPSAQTSRNLILQPPNRLNRRQNRRLLDKSPAL